MKKILLLLSLSSLLLLSSCYIENDNIQVASLSQVFETTVDFTNANDYSQLVNIPIDIEVYESDVILVYWLENVISDGTGGTFDVWTPLPQTIYTTQGSFQYSFNHTFIDVFLFLQGDINLDSLSSNLTNNQTFRIAIVGAEFAKTNPSMQQVLGL
ncbi:MAG: hypothetical protein P8Q43_02205 [Ulvibacter sp.]|jgi:hypothetical protein|nr:hypothetical protein [Ulvibacter sp.]